MAKIPFSIDYKLQIESGEYKVETRDGSPARVVCWDANSCSPILFLVTEHDDLDDKDKEYAYSCNNFGRAFSIESPKDLFIVTPDPELTKFEQEVRDCIVENLTTHGREMSSTVFIGDDTAKKLASELFCLARNQLQIEGLVTMEHLNKACEAEYQSGLADGKNEALNDLPRWKKATGKERFNERMIVLAGDNDLLCTNYAEEGEYYISFSALEKLPKED